MAVGNPKRAAVKVTDTWDLSQLYADDSTWDQDLEKLRRRTAGSRRFKGKLGESAAFLAGAFRLDSQLDRLAERLGAYAFLRTAEDQTNPTYQAMWGRFQAVMTRVAEAFSFIRPEILAIPAQRLDRFLKDRKVQPFALIVERLRRFAPYTLSPNEERLLAMQGEMSQAAGRIFRQLLDSDLKFGTIDDGHGGTVELTHASFMGLLQSPNRTTRKQAFHQYYTQFEAHENTLAAALAGSVHKDVYYARARGYASARDAALFPDQVPGKVYDALVKSVRSHLPAVHRYLELRRRHLKLRELHHYDTYVPILSQRAAKRSWKEATELVLESLGVLGGEYVDVLAKGLRGRWCDRYPNQGKQSGAFSYGTFDGEPYILMNYRPELLEDVFTLTHEAGHSMHSHLSAKHQPFEYYQYSIFVAEVASTFNEQLLAHHLLSRAKDREERAHLINREIDSIRATIVRQTMFAEYEQRIHEMAESGDALTTASLRSTYRDLLQAYFGDRFAIDEALSLEALRIPHFYRAFYVYKYATGLSAAIALSQKVLGGNPADLARYLQFLQGGCSRDPLDLLRDAGVDMESSAPVNAALNRFDALVKELDELL